MRVKPDQITRAIQIAKAISERIDPAFSRVAMDIDPDSPLAQRMGMLRSIKRVEPYRPTEGFSRGGYASGGTDQDNPYSQPDDMGLYSHAANVASQLPQATMSPGDMRQALLGRGVKESELKWGEYDYAFGDQPKVSRDEVAKHLWANMPPVVEKTLQRRQPGQLSLRDLSDKHYEERQRLWDEEDAAPSSPAELNQRRREMRERHMAERNNAWQGDPYHENLTIPGGENYREILLKHGSGDMYPGVSAHFGGEPDVLASMMVKDRTDHEGDKVLHIDELQSDWAQRGRREGFSGPVDEDRYQRLSAITPASRTPEEDFELGELKRKIKGITPAPYVTKTEDWVDLGLKRALREAAEKGYDKLVWSPGHVIADRYDLAKHVDQIRHARNDDGTYDLRVDNLQGDRVFGKDRMTPEEVESHFGKGMAEKIMAGHGDPDESPTNRDWRTLKGVDLRMGEKWPFEMYDRMIPKRALRLAKQHDPDAQLEQSVITHGGGFNFGSAASVGKQTALHAIRITPQMRESILKRGFSAYADGGEVREHFRLGGAEDSETDAAIAPEQDHPLTQDVYHGTKEIMVGPARAWETGQEMFQSRNPKDVSFLPNVTALSLGPHVARDPNISGHERFTTGENLDLSTDEKPVPLKAQGKVMMLKTFPHERFYQVPQNIKEDVRSVNPADRDDNAVHNFVFDVVLRRDPELAKRVVQHTYGLEDDEAKKFVEGFTSPEGLEDPFTPGHRYPSLAHFLRYNNLTVNPKDHDLIIKKFRKIMRDKGYVGLSYSNTDYSEIRNAKDRTCYIVFPQRDKETGWSPLRLRGAKFDPERRGRPGLHEADGGAVEGYADGGGIGDDAPPSAFFEVAPGKTWDAGQQALWEQLHPQAKAAISNKMIGEFVSRWQRQTGVQGEVRPGLGGFEGNTNPNYTFHPYDPNHIGLALKGLGELFRQDAMMGAHAHPFEGSFPAGVVRVNLPKNMNPKAIHAIYSRLNKLGLAEGHSTDIGNGTMDIIHDSHEAAIDAANKIDAALKGRRVIESFPTNIAFPAHGVDYGSISSISGSPQSSTSPAHGDLQAEASSRLAELLAEAHRQGGGHQGPVSFGDTLSPGQPHPDTVSALMPTTASAYKGPPRPGQVREDVSPSKHTPENLDAISTRMWKQHPASGGEELAGPEARDKLLNLYVNNLLNVWDRTPVGQRKTSRFWYRAAHALGNAYAEHHDIAPRAAHAIMAVLSPQNPWDKNVTQAERVMDILHHRLDQPWTEGMTQTAFSGGSSGKGLPYDKGTKETGPHLWEDIQGKTLREVLAMPHGQKKAAMWIRAFDEAHNPTEYRAVSPTGEFLGTQLNKTGKAPDTASWNSYSPIAKAISIWHDPSLENINQQVGRNHKVREFYNNITNPHDPNVIVADTHAVAAGEFLPHGSSSKAVLHNFGSIPDTRGKQSLVNEGTPWNKDDTARMTGSTGAIGDYPLHAEAVRRAAWARGVHPSEMQSVTWETVRTIFKNKSAPVKKAAREIWGRYANGELTHAQAIDQIVDMATAGKGLTKPTWGGQAGQGIGKVQVGSYIKPGDISPETPANKRYKAFGGDVSSAKPISKALLVSLRAQKKAKLQSRG